jgi:hypothetical protein
VAERPWLLDLAWHSTENNEVGLHELAGWLRLRDVCDCTFGFLFAEPVKINMCRPIVGNSTAVIS